MAEQAKRHAQHNNTESNLEPDIKNAPGGIRDMNQIGWIAKRHFRVNRIYDLVHLGFITEYELKILEEAESFYGKFVITCTDSANVMKIGYCSIINVKLQPNLGIPA